MSGIIIVGAAGSGKDTLAAWITRDFGATPIGFADPIRAFVQDLLGPGKHRAAAQAIGDAIRAEDPTAFIRRAQERAAQTPRYLLTDARLPAELAAFPDALSIGLVCPTAERARRLAARDGRAFQPLDHATETAVDALIARCALQIHNDTPTLATFEQAYTQALKPLLTRHFAYAPTPVSPSPIARR